MNAAARLIIIIGLVFAATAAWAQADPHTIGSGVTRVEFVVDAPPQVFDLLTDSQVPTTISAHAEPADFPYLVEIRDPRGNVSARLTNVLASRLTLDNSNRSYQITITANNPAREGVVILDVSGSLDPTPTPTLTPVPTATPELLSGAVVCYISTNSRVNIRREPNRDAEVVGLLTVRTQIGANRLSADGLWYGVVLLDDTQAWVFSDAIREVTPCGFAAP